MIKTIIQVIGPLSLNQRVCDTMCVLEVFIMIKKVHVKGERQKYYKRRVVSTLQLFTAINNFLLCFLILSLNLAKTFYDNAPKNV